MEMVVILVIALLVLGPSRLPEAARSLGRGFRELRESLQAGGEDEDEDEDDHAGRRQASPPSAQYAEAGPYDDDLPPIEDPDDRLLEESPDEDMPTERLQEESPDEDMPTERLPAEQLDEASSRPGRSS
jgi:sec-independent protein translocase protein TatA